MPDEEDKLLELIRERGDGERKEICQGKVLHIIKEGEKKQNQGR